MDFNNFANPANPLSPLNPASPINPMNLERASQQVPRCPECGQVIRKEMGAFECADFGVEVLTLLICFVSVGYICIDILRDWWRSR